MSGNPYKEYFIGGPWHGEDRRDKLSINVSYTGIIEYEMIKPEEFSEKTSKDPIIAPLEVIRGYYASRRVWITDAVFMVWVDVNETEETASRKLRDLILAPHKR